MASDKNIHQEGGRAWSALPKAVDGEVRRGLKIGTPKWILHSHQHILCPLQWTLLKYRYLFVYKSNKKLDSTTIPYFTNDKCNVNFNGRWGKCLTSEFITQHMDFAILILTHGISVVWKKNEILGKLKYLRAIHREKQTSNWGVILVK